MGLRSFPLLSVLPSCVLIESTSARTRCRQHFGCQAIMEGKNSQCSGSRVGKAFPERVSLSHRLSHTRWPACLQGGSVSVSVQATPLLDCLQSKCWWLRGKKAETLRSRHECPKHGLLSSATALFLPRSWFLFVLF